MSNIIYPDVDCLNNDLIEGSGDIPNITAIKPLNYDNGVLSMNNISNQQITTVSIDGTFSNAVDTKLSTQKAIKTYVDNNITTQAETLFNNGTLFVASYSSSINANYSGGSPTGTISGTASINNGYLVLGNYNSYVSYPATGNANFTQTGTIHFKITPAYSGIPIVTVGIISLGAYQDGNNALWITHSENFGSIYFDMYSSTGSLIQTANLGNWNPVAGTEYDMEIDIDITNGASRLFIDGNQFGSTVTGTGTRTDTVATLQVGSNVYNPLTCRSNFSIRDLHIFNVVKHTTNFNPNDPYTYTIYATGLNYISSLNVDDIYPSKQYVQTINIDTGNCFSASGYNTEIILQKIGTLITLQVRGHVAQCNFPSNIYSANGAVPSIYAPATTQSYQIPVCLNNDSSWGHISVDANGKILISPDTSGFDAGYRCGFPTVSVSWQKI